MALRDASHPWATRPALSSFEETTLDNNHDDLADERPVTGIVDLTGEHGIVRVDGYLPGPSDIHLPAALVRRWGLRPGDLVTGTASPSRGAAGQRDRRQGKHSSMSTLDTVNNLSPDGARRRPDFYHLTPVHPRERLRLETEPPMLTTRVIDLLMPIGKGQRTLIVSPPKAGKTMVLQAIAAAITRNHPECHLMVLLVDERPEEVTDMQRSVKGEVIASPFDRPPPEHTAIAELAVERAKRLVELGHDVVLLLDSLTRLGRAYNHTAPSSARILSGGISSTALQPPKRLLGAARNIEDGGSLTIIASTLVETGSVGDTLIYEEYKGTGNAELRLDRASADRRLFPAVDVHSSSTRNDNLLLDADEAIVIGRLRKALHNHTPQQALQALLERLARTRSNAEFLLTAQR
ncbi:transcription termination factor Rho [Micromonospora sp. CPCC 205371]|nr:transcription termination factor Rho [Micromonospora sp. CPCC 205371]